ncbi:MAG TPA: hypothetical protein VJ692_16925 [Nitrospiraceae bacterium]|nr:hypothetical protein [Nitrospiraceae bacterium]
MYRTMQVAVYSAILLAVLSACASAVPPSRLAAYVGSPGDDLSFSPDLPPRPVRAGLVLIPDTSARDAAPALPDEALARLTESLQRELSHALPIVIERLIPAEGISPAESSSQLTELGQQYGVDYLVFVVVSSTEQEYPMTIFLGWTTHSQPGWRRDNWSLIEIALVDVKTGRTLIRAEGRGWATLDRPTAPGINQWYPVIWLRPQDPVRRIWPPTYAGAPNTLRVVAMNEAVKRVVLNFQEAWIQKRESEWQTAQG